MLQLKIRSGGTAQFVCVQSHKQNVVGLNSSFVYMHNTIALVHLHYTMFMMCRVEGFATSAKAQLAAVRPWAI